VPGCHPLTAELRFLALLKLSLGRPPVLGTSPLCPLEVTCEVLRGSAFRRKTKPTYLSATPASVGTTSEY
jgi:hypothetical protein